jgi:hypothetical protein
MTRVKIKKQRSFQKLMKHDKMSFQKLMKHDKDTILKQKMSFKSLVDEWLPSAAL